MKKLFKGKNLVIALLLVAITFGTLYAARVTHFTRVRINKEDPATVAGSSLGDMEK